jgi:cell division transport system ATP-binding protein
LQQLALKGQKPLAQGNTLGIKRYWQYALKGQKLSNTLNKGEKIRMLIDYQNVSIYQADKCVLQNINFHIDEGEFAYLIGKVGSGKSSLLKTLYCELDLVEGETEKAEILGRDLKTIRRKEIPALRKELGIIFQDFQLLHDRTVRKNFEFVLKATGWKNKKDREKRIEEVLNEVGMIDKIDKMPHELSGGEQQRVAIARAILNNPKIIIADEPTGNLDPETASNIVSLLKDITKQGTAVVMTTHNIPMLDKFPGIVYRCKEGVLYDVTNEYNHIDLTEDGEDN